MVSRFVVGALLAAILLAALLVFAAATTQAAPAKPLPTCSKAQETTGRVVKRETLAPPYVRETLQTPDGTRCYRLVTDAARPGGPKKVRK